jgi:chromatin remodeling complex protein RSC6
MSEQTQTPETTTTPETESTVKQMLEALLEISAQQAQQTREMHRNLKKLSQEVEREQRRLQRTSKPRRTVRQRPVSVNAAMRKFLDKQGVTAEDGGFTRQSMMKAVSAYIKTKELQLAENRKSWKADKELVKLFGLDAKETYTFMNINGLLSRVVEKSD